MIDIKRFRKSHTNRMSQPDNVLLKDDKRKAIQIPLHT
jgi:hypothetical protein